MHKSRKRLAIDTATEYVYLSLVIDDSEIDSVYEEGLNNHSVTVIPHLVGMLNRHKLQLKDIDEVICGVGPGSYTGIRIAVTIAKMIGYLNRIEVKAVSSLALIASSKESGPILAVIDARRGNAFMALFDHDGNRLIRKGKDILDNVEEYKSVIPEATTVISKGKPNIEKIIDSDLLETVDDVIAMVPNYLQITEAEKNRCSV